MLQPGDVYELAIHQSYSQQELINVLHFKCLRAISGAQASFQTLADDIKEAMRPQQSAALSYTGWHAQQVAGDTISYSPTTCRRSGGDVYEGALTGTLVGGRSGTFNDASFVAMVVALKTGLAGRSRRGSYYIGGWYTTDRSATDVNRFTSTLPVAVNALAAALLVKYGVPSGTNLDFGWVVFSRFIASGCKYVNTASGPVYTHVQAGDQPNAKADVKSATARDLIVPMRRRKEGRGV